MCQILFEPFINFGVIPKNNQRVNNFIQINYINFKNEGKSSGVVKLSL